MSMSEDDLKAYEARFTRVLAWAEALPARPSATEASMACLDGRRLLAEVRKVRALAGELAEALEDASEFCPGTPSYPMAIWPALAKARAAGLLAQ